MTADRDRAAMSEAARLRREMYAEIRGLRSEMNDRVGYVDRRLTRHIGGRMRKALTGYEGSSYKGRYKLMDFLIKVLWAEVVLIWVLVFILYWIIFTEVL